MAELKKKKGEERARNVNGFHQATPSFTNVFWKSRKRAGILDMKKENILVKSKEKQEESCVAEKPHDSTCKYMQQDSNNLSILPEKRKALYEPLDPIANNNGKHPNAESFLPPPDFESTSYPRGWLIGKKRKLVNVDVVESMRRIAIQEMNRKDREIDGLNEQLDEDARCLEHLQLQLLEERSNRAEVERQNAMLQNQITMLVDMLQENEHMDDEGNDQGL